MTIYIENNITKVAVYLSKR